MPERISAWQCIGCGRIEGAQPCIGICEDRKREFVYAADYDEAMKQVEQARARTDQLAAIVRRIASITPRAGECERNYRALQSDARAALKSLYGDSVDTHAATAGKDGS